MKKIIFINPRLIRIKLKQEKRIQHRIWPPIILASGCTAAKEQGYEAQLFDLNIEEDLISFNNINFKEIEKVIITTSPIDRWQCPPQTLDHVKGLVKGLRSQNVKEMIIFGPHGTMKPKETFKILKPDLMILGEPENTIERILRNEDWSDLEGVVYLQGQKLIIKPKILLKEMDQLKMPDYNSLKLNKYNYPLLGSGKFTLMEFSRGCPYSCFYCMKKMYRKGYKTKSVEKFIEELKLAKRQGIKNIYIIDLEFTLNPNLIERLCERIKEEKMNMRWCCQTRADTLTDSLLKKMREAGCRLIHFGVETGSERIMKIIKKQITLEQIRRGIKLIKKNRIQTACFFMLGFPQEKKEDIQKTIKFAKEINPDYVSFNIATPYPTTDFYDHIQYEKGYIPRAYTEEIDYDDLRRIVSKAYKEFYLRPRIIIRELFRNPLNVPRRLTLFFSYVTRYNSIK
jgi:radical SAM superfamily enzyme YgiQ (UPF0313 family)